MLDSIQRVLQVIPNKLSLQGRHAGSASTIITKKTALQLSKPELGYAVGGLTAFSLILVDVSSPWSLHLLRPLDIQIHELVAHNITANERFLADKLLSDGCIVFGLAGWIITVSQALLSNRPATQRTALTAVAMYILAGGSFPHWDPPLVRLLKDSVHRIRPSPEGHHSYSFPSGHTTAATFIVGVLVCLLIPSILAINKEKQTEINPSGVMNVDNPAVRALAVVGAAVSTGAGRVLADAHWTTDVVAGGLLGMSLIAGTMLLCEAVNSVAEGVLGVQEGRK